MLSKRLRAIASFVEKKDCLVDVGCDHGYLGIYLKENENCQNMILSDLRQSALNNAIENIKKHNLKIKTIISRGLDNIDTNNLNTIVISGMGTKTITEILVDKEKLKPINKIIIQSNNNLKELREFMNNIGYYLNDEITIFEGNIWYVICEFRRGHKRLNYKIKNFGLKKEDKEDYYRYLLKSYQHILQLLPRNNFFTKIDIKYKIFNLKQLLKESW